MTDNSDFMQARISGTVGRTGTASSGPYADVEVQRANQQYPDRVTVWGLDAATGDRVVVKGELSWRKSEKDGKTYMNVAINKPTVEAHTKASAASGNDETPF